MRREINATNNYPANVIYEMDITDTDLPCAEKPGMKPLNRTYESQLSESRGLILNFQMFQLKDPKSDQSLSEISSGGSRIGPLGAVVFSALCQRHALSPSCWVKENSPKGEETRCRLPEKGEAVQQIG